MFKKIFVIIVMTLFLVGCGEKKITEDMLIGSWYCDTVTQKGYISQNNKYFSYGEKISNTDKVIYGKFINNGKLYSISGESQMLDIVLNPIKPKVEIKKTDDNVSYHEISGYNYINDNKYMHFIYVESFNKTNPFSSRAFKVEATCLRAE